MTPERPDHLRVSDAVRHEVAEVLRRAAGEGRLDLDELDERLEAAYAARTYGDLVPLTADLPPEGGPHAPAVPARAPASPPAPVGGAAGPSRPSRHLAMMGGVERTGEWTVPAEMTVTCVMGGADLDFRQARFSARECVLRVNAFMGGATVVVPPGVEVVVEGTGIMGGYSSPGRKVPAELGPDSPVLRVRGVAVWGGVSVERRPLDPPAVEGGRKPHRLH